MSSAATLRPDRMPVLRKDLWLALGRGDEEEAERLASKVLASAPNDLLANYAVGTLRWPAGRLIEAESAFLRALNVAGLFGPLSPAIRCDLGMVQLALGKYAPETWGHYDQRHHCPAFRPKPAHLLAAPEWLGEDLTGKHLVIYPEQGDGDEIQFARFAPWLLENTGAERVTLVCDERLVRLFEGLGVEVRGGVEFCYDGYTQRTADAWVMSTSIPGRAGIELETLPSAPYLRAPEARLTGARVGVVTRGNPQHTNDAHRSLPPAQAHELLSLPGAMSLHPEDTGARDYADTAAIIAGLELVISVDTSVAHLAGAMGKPVWVLLPAHLTDWCWMRGRADSPWYPSARLYRQAAAGDWAPVLSAVRCDLGS